MASQAATNHPVGNGISVQDLENVQTPLQEPGTRHISELLNAKCLTFMKSSIDAPVWSGTEFSYQERMALLMSSWRDAAQSFSHELLKGCFSTIDHGETDNGVHAIHAGMTAGLEPIMSVLSSHSSCSSANGLHSAPVGALATRIASSARQSGTHGRKRVRIMTSSFRPSGLDDDASLNSATNSDDEALRSNTIVPCKLINPRNGEKVRCRSLLDTGADESAMKRSLANRVVGEGNFEPHDDTEVEVKGVGGIVKPVGKITCILKLACSKSITTTFYVLDDKDLPDLDICLSLRASVETEHVIIPPCRRCNRSTCAL
jgi:hypothetical protein